MKLTFIGKGKLRKVDIKGKKIMFETTETGREPIFIDLEKLNKSQINKMRLSKEELVVIRKLSKLSDEKKIARDITKDFQKTGWRLAKTE